MCKRQNEHRDVEATEEQMLAERHLYMDEGAEYLHVGMLVVADSGVRFHAGRTW